MYHFLSPNFCFVCICSRAIIHKFLQQNTFLKRKKYEFKIGYNCIKINSCSLNHLKIKVNGHMLLPSFVLMFFGYVIEEYSLKVILT